MIGVVVPAHDEEALIGVCLRALQECARDPALDGEQVAIIVVLDRCSDRTDQIAAEAGVNCLQLSAGNVGIARAAGFSMALAMGARWIATTDADSAVPADWLSAQLAHGCDAFCGVITVADWHEYDDAVSAFFMMTECRLENHPHVHGANLGLSAEAYALSGGFLPLPAHEDVALVHTLERSGVTIARKLTPVVVTSARRHARAVGGFSDYLRALEAKLLESPSAMGAATMAVGGTGGGS